MGSTTDVLGTGVSPDADVTAGTPAAAPGARLPTAEPLPVWFERGLVTACAAVLSFGGFGLLLAILGHYRMATAGALGALGTLVGSWLAWPRGRPAPRARGATLAATGMCVVAIGFAAWNGLDAGHHVTTERDPGVYTVAGKWIATRGDLDVETGAEWTAKGGAAAGLRVDTPGAYADGPNRVEFQFNHLLPVLLAEANNLGGDPLMFRVPALLGALALCAVYAAGCRLVPRPGLVLAAVGALALSLPQLSVSRDTYSESAAQFLLWSGLWLVLVALARRQLGPALLAGAALGGTMLSRIDGLVYLIPLPALAAMAWLAARSGADRRFLLRMYGVVLVGAVPPAVLGLVDVVHHAGRYYTDLHGQVRTLQAGLALSVVAAVALLLASRTPYAVPVAGWVRSRRPAIAAVAAGGIGGGLLAAWALRPAVQHPRGNPIPLVGGLQAAAGLPPDPSRTYAENTVTWLAWYLGPVAVTLAIVGAAILAARLCRRPDAASALMLVPGLATAAYLWNPSITPDQIWAARRFVPAGFPLVVLLAVLAVEAFALAASTATRRIPPAPIWAAGAAGLLAYPLGVTAPVRHFQPLAGHLGAVENVCRATGPRAAMLFADDDRGGLVLSPALRTWCDVPVAVLTDLLPERRLREIAGAWRAEGRSLWVLASGPDLLARSAPWIPPRLIASAGSLRDLERTLNRPPQLYSITTVSVYGGIVDAAPTTPGGSGTGRAG
ncbi:MAG: hypothetical protein ACM3ZF_01915 [Mycobacterium leprae]